MDYLPAMFGDISFNRFGFIMQTNTQTDTQQQQQHRRRSSPYSRDCRRRA